MKQFNIGLVNRNPFIIQGDDYKILTDEFYKQTLEVYETDSLKGQFRDYDYFTVVEVTTPEVKVKNKKKTEEVKNAD